MVHSSGRPKNTATMHLFGLVLLLSSQIVSIWGNPIPEVSPQRRDLPLDLSTIGPTAEGLLHLGKGIAQEAALLEAGLLGAKDGRIEPVSSLEDAISSLSSMPNASDHDTIRIATEIVTRGLAPMSILEIVAGITDSRINSEYNENPTDPDTPTYPKKDIDDAPYDLSEDRLRSAIHIPRSFEYGANGKQPVLLVPGTNIPAGSTYHFNYAKLLASTDFADPVWVNIPGYSLGDVQVNSEYVAYAMNYIAGISNSTIGVISWSQGGLDVQWALKYWPSTRDVLEDLMALSADFHETLFELLCITPNLLCTPSVKQQGADSNLIQALLADDGDSAYVPTTSVYSGLDQVVEPQSDPNASGALKDVRNVGVTNAQIQLVCPGKPAGSIYLHETMLVNPIAYALFVDALTHDGPGQLSRIDLDTVCSQLVPPGLDLDDLLGTEAATAVLAVLDILSYGYLGDNTEPPLKNYTRT